tara:strand:+ start:1908 stop:2186 length:279 start_codon:yes stop_codon:yes gene_type:complete
MNRIDYELAEALNTPQQWIAVQQMKEEAKEMLWRYREMIIDFITSTNAMDLPLYTQDELIDKLKSGASYNWWVGECLPSDHVINTGIYGEEE